MKGRRVIERAEGHGNYTSFGFYNLIYNQRQKLFNSET